MINLNLFSKKEKIAVFHHNHRVQNREIMVQQIKTIISPKRIENQGYYFSSWGRLMEYSQNYESEAHYLTPLSDDFNLSIILERAIPLPMSEALAALMGEILVRMGKGSSVLIQSSLIKDRWITPEFFKRYIPSVRVKDNYKNKKGWIHIGWAPGVAQDLSRLVCTYTKLSRNLDGFREIANSTGNILSEPTESYYDSVENAFCYSMYWAMLTRHVIDKMLTDFNHKGEMVGMDIGGAYGFLACELAAQGHSVTNLELLSWNVDAVMPWLAETTGTASRVKGISKAMEDIEVDEANKFDFVCFMGSLLCIERQDINSVMKSVIKMIKPGGYLFFRENLEVTENPYPEDTVKRFTANEFHSILENTGGEIIYYDHLGNKNNLGQMQKLWTVYAGVKLP